MIFVRYQGTAFKNVHGNFCPVIGLGSVGCSVVVNFGQAPFMYDDLSSLVIACKEKAQLDNAGHLVLLSLQSTLVSSDVFHQALSFSSEIVLLLRHLLNSPKWKQQIVDQILLNLRFLPTILLGPG